MLQVALLARHDSGTCCDFLFLLESLDAVLRNDANVVHVPGKRDGRGERRVGTAYIRAKKPSEERSSEGDHSKQRVSVLTELLRSTHVKTVNNIKSRRVPSFQKVTLSPRRSGQCYNVFGIPRIDCIYKRLTRLPPFDSVVGKVPVPEPNSCYILSI